MNPLERKSDSESPLPDTSDVPTQGQIQDTPTGNADIPMTSNQSGKRDAAGGSDGVLVELNFPAVAEIGNVSLPSDDVYLEDNWCKDLEDSIAYSSHITCLLIKAKHRDQKAQATIKHLEQAWLAAEKQMNQYEADKVVLEERLQTALAEVKTDKEAAAKARAERDELCNKNDLLSAEVELLKRKVFDQGKEMETEKEAAAKARAECDELRYKNALLATQVEILLEKASDQAVERERGSNMTLDGFHQKRQKISTNDLLARPDPLTLENMSPALASGKFGSVAKDIPELIARKEQFLKTDSAMKTPLGVEQSSSKVVLDKNQPTTSGFQKDNLDDNNDNYISEGQLLLPAKPVPSSVPILIIDSDDEDCSLRKSTDNFSSEHLKDCNGAQSESLGDKDEMLADEAEHIKDKGVYVGLEHEEEDDEQADENYDGLADIWQEMGLAIACSKAPSEDLPTDEHTIKGGEECDHVIIRKDDIGDVCRICGFIQQGIESILEFQYPKGKKRTRTYQYEGRSSSAEPSQVLSDRMESSSHDSSANEIYAHPRHQKLMKPHQVEGFNFLISNLMVENPGGCIMAHAPGSGKTFMIICFLQSFMAKYPLARPLVVLPRGIVETWKHEFQRWQVENIELHDFYSVKAESRLDQLEVLQQWRNARSILFLGYKQFSAIVCDHDIGNISTACQEILLTCPSILILDEGHTPRNRDTNILASLEKVQTPRKVVLSGTLYQNHVKEVFNVLNLVRPKFLKMEDSRAIKTRILSRLSPSSRRNVLKNCSENEFCELVEQALLKDEKDENFKRKVKVIQDLREMTSRVLHYYKGDFLDELPGLVDFNILLRMSPMQEKEVAELKKMSNRFKITFEGSAIYMHPQLKNLPKISGVKDRAYEESIDRILETLDVREGVKAKFYLNLLELCEANHEKLLVFSQYLLPLKFLERLTMKEKGYRVGQEIFFISGDSDSEMRELSMERFNTSRDARVFFGSIKACGEGISLVGASRILILDVHLNPSVTRQAIGRAFRPGQRRKVYTYRLIAHDSPEEEDHRTCFRKESISKLWFEWDEHRGNKDFEMEVVHLSTCDDPFLESPRLNQDVLAVYKR